MGVMLLLAAAFQEDTNPSSGGGGLVGALFGGAFMLIWLAVVVLVFVSLWKIFEKAGKPGWAGIVPIYNIIVWLELVGRPIWWIVLMFVPCVSIVVGILLCIDLAKAFGKDAGYAQIKLNSGELRLVPAECLATVGAVSNPDNQNIVIGKAGRSRWLGIRPTTRGVAMNPVDHPHGGGEGRTSGGRHPVTPWGKPTKGKKTRKNKATDKYIIRRRGATR